jgi:WD40-like Beta Propeller Repeat
MKSSGCSDRAAWARCMKPATRGSIDAWRSSCCETVTPNFSSDSSASHIWFVRNRAVFAPPFDAVSRTAREPSVTVVANIGYNATNHYADYSVASDGTLAYASDAGREQLTWIDRATGRFDRVPDDESIGFNWRVSPDGERLAYSAAAPDSPQTPQPGLIVWDMRRAVKTRMIPDVLVASYCIAWSSAGDRLAVSGQRNGDFLVLALSPSGAATTQTLLSQADGACVRTWTPDGRYVLVRERERLSMMAVAVAAGRPPLTLEPAIPRGSWNAAISPDGRWVVYTLFERARWEGYIQRFPPDGARRNSRRTRL